MKTVDGFETVELACPSVEIRRNGYGEHGLAGTTHTVDKLCFNRDGASSSWRRL
jgi:hypothetical protein